MNLFVSILGLAVMLVVIGVALFERNKVKNDNNEMRYDYQFEKRHNPTEEVPTPTYKTFKVSKYIPGVIIGLIIWVFGFSFVIIPTGHTAVKTTFGQISQQVYTSGFHFKLPFVQVMKKIDNRKVDKKFEGEKIWGEADDKTPVYAEKFL